MGDRSNAMAQRNLVLFDLEWNIGYQPYKFNYHGVEQTLRGEIIEIGAVKIDEDANVLDTFSVHLRPRIFRRLQHHIAKVTGLTQADLDRGEPILQGLRRFMKWCGPDAEFAEWGLDDVPVLGQLCRILTGQAYESREETSYVQVQLPEIKNTGDSSLEQRVNLEISAVLNREVEESKEFMADDCPLPLSMFVFA